MRASPEYGSDVHLPIRLILLVGFMASGKTSVGTRLAAHLGWEFVDADAAIEERTGECVPALFRQRGEEGFREVEARVTAELLRGSRRVLASGGGWPAAGPDRLDALPSDVLSIWLQVDPRVAVERASRDGRSRPLLLVDEPEEWARELLAARKAAYARARMHLDASEASPRTLVAAIVEYLDEIAAAG